MVREECEELTAIIRDTARGNYPGRWIARDALKCIDYLQDENLHLRVKIARLYSQIDDMQRIIEKREWVSWDEF